MSEVFTYAQRYVSIGGLSVIPIKTDGTKKAAITWGKYQHKKPSTDEIIRHFKSNGCGIAVIGGEVSGGLEVLDFDVDAKIIFPKWKDAVTAAGLGDILNNLPIDETPSGGYHVFFRSNSSSGNTKLARRPIVRREKKELDELIETRGEGGYAILPGSPASCHSSGIPYRLIQGDLTKIPMISESARRIFLSEARAFNEYFEEYKIPTAISNQSNLQRPGDDFNQRASWNEILEPHGWRCESELKGEIRWIRPGGDRPSAVSNHFGDDKLKVWSSNASPFKDAHTYTKFAAYALLEHGGDFSSAALQLAAKGYGTPTKKLSSRIPHLKDVLKEQKTTNTNNDSFIETAQQFLSKEDEEREFIIPEIIPAGSLISFSGHPRAMKSLGADELMIAAGTGTPAFGLARFKPVRTVKCWRIAQEDPERDERQRIKALLAARDITTFPENVYFSIHKAVNLDDEKMQERIIQIIEDREIELIIIDPIRRFSAKVDKGPSDVRELTAYLRRIVIQTGCTVIVIHHFVKESASKVDDRRRAHRTSGGDWFAAVECPIFFEKIADDKTLVVPEDFKFSADPDAFTFRFLLSNNGNISLIGETEHEKEASNLAIDSKIIEFLKESPHKSGDQIRKTLRIKRDICYGRLDALQCKSILDFEKKGNAKLWFPVGL